ncbi:MAG: Na+/H+ antiporter NhaC family protein [Rubrobacter sp.]|nr:Na+/H+ antiporter NhaC family protein [Rubrobacter sp.]
MFRKFARFGRARFARREWGGAPLRDASGVGSRERHGGETSADDDSGRVRGEFFGRGGGSIGRPGVESFPTPGFSGFSPRFHVPGSRGRAAAILLLVVAVVSLLFAPHLSRGAEAQSGEYSFEAPRVVLDGVPFTVEAEGPDGDASLRVGGEEYEASFSDGAATFEDVVVSGGGEVSMSLLAGGGEEISEQTTRSIPGWLSILPPVIAIGVALLTRQVIPALFLGIWAGAAMVYGLSFGALWSGLLDVLGVYVLEALSPPDGDTGHASIIVFTLMIGGMVGIISRNGGTKGVVNRIVGFASNPRRGQLTTGTLGVAIFFDDYANSLVVGNTMRPITDRLRISREKLAYIVDSTAAPVATIALITTWIGFQVGLIGDAIGSIEGFGQSAYSVFLSSIPYSFYPMLAILFVFAVAITGRDFGPMRAAEERARTEGKVMRDGASVDPEAAGDDETRHKEGVPERAYNALIPIGVLIGGAMAGLYVTGSGDNIRDIIGSADSFSALVWASLLSVLAAAILSVGQRILTLGEVVDAWYSGLRSMLLVLIILVMAWSLSNVTDVLRTGDFLVSVLGESLSPALLPALIFLVAAATAFSTGTSWGTMGILVPLTVPLAWAIMGANGLANADGYYLMYASVASVLAGAVWGDHCSPISDTTIISSMASGCDHIDHVRTQIPYALFVGGVAILLGLLPVGFGVPWWIVLPVAAVASVGGLYVMGKKVSDPVYGSRPERSSAKEPMTPA